MRRWLMSRRGCSRGEDRNTVRWGFRATHHFGDLDKDQREACLCLFFSLKVLHETCSTNLKILGHWNNVQIANTNCILGATTRSHVSHQRKCLPILLFDRASSAPTSAEADERQPNSNRPVLSLFCSLAECCRNIRDRSSNITIIFQQRWTAQVTSMPETVQLAAVLDIRDWSQTRLPVAIDDRDVEISKAFHKIYAGTRLFGIVLVIFLSALLLFASLLALLWEITCRKATSIRHSASDT
jgi:hypothetical protein